jgi:hypothetical protein
MTRRCVTKLNPDRHADLIVSIGFLRNSPRARSDRDSSEEHAGDGVAAKEMHKAPGQGLQKRLAQRDQRFLGKRGAWQVIDP